jgi:amidohydrolase
MCNLAELEKNIHTELVGIWHHLHENPELSFKEFKTADYVEKILKETTKLDRIQRVGETGIWAELVGTAPGAENGPVITLRADMDALPIEEQSGVAFSSKTPGVMHACGHDVHTTSLLGVVRILEQYRDKIPGKIWFFFQPAEEIVSGAVTFIADPAIDFTKIKAIAGVHMMGLLDVGTVGVREGSLMAGGDEVFIDVKGLGGHAAAPHKCKDAIVAASSLILQLQTLVSRELDPVDSGVLTFGLIRGGTKNNIIAGDVRIEGTLRTLNKTTRDAMHSAIRRVCEGVGQSLGVTIEAEILTRAEPLVNDAACVKVAEAALEKTIGKENIVQIKVPTMGAEDFAFYLNEVPGVFMFVGSRNIGGKDVNWHTSDFYTNEGAIKTAVLALTGFALESFGVPF